MSPSKPTPLPKTDPERFVWGDDQLETILLEDEPDVIALASDITGKYVRGHQPEE